MIKKILLPIKHIYILLIWLGIALLYGGQRYIQYSLDGEECHFLLTIFEHVPTFMTWAVLAPLIQLQIQKSPIINSAKKLRDFLAHFVLATTLSLLVLAIIGFFRWMYYRPYNHMEWLEYLRQFMLLWFIYQYFQYGSMLVFLLALNYYQKFKDKETQSIQLQRDLYESRLTVLKSQLHPHFLFNTLNSVSMLIRLDKKNPAIKVITLFGDLLRHTLQKTEDQFTTIDAELDFIEKYLKIESVRFEDNFSYTINKLSEVQGIRIPDMVLQPVVENCIKHGFKEDVKDFKIDIDVRLKKEWLIISITDNGIGSDFSDETIFQKGIGLRNIRERCLKLYGSDCVEIFSKAGDGTTVNFSIPINSIEWKK